MREPIVLCGFFMSASPSVRSDDEAPEGGVYS